MSKKEKKKLAALNSLKHTLDCMIAFQGELVLASPSQTEHLLRHQESHEIELLDSMDKVFGMLEGDV